MSSRIVIILDRKSPTDRRSCSRCFFDEYEVPYLLDSPPLTRIKFLDHESVRLFKVGAYSRLGAH